MRFRVGVLRGEGGAGAGLVKVPRLLTKDRSRYDELFGEVVGEVRRFGRYSRFDNLVIDRMVRAVIYSERAEAIIDSNPDDSRVLSAMTDVLTKQNVIIRDCIKQLAMSRRDRISKETVQEMEVSLQQLLDRVPLPRESGRENAQV